jgi:hypothetical protein
MAISGNRIRIDVGRLRYSRSKCGEQIAWEWMVESPSDSHGASLAKNCPMSCRG